MSYTLRPFASGDTLVASRDPIRTNFSVIQDRFNDNHVGINSGSGGGKHKFMQMPEQSAAPSTAVNEGALYTKEQSGATELFFRRENNGSEMQITTVSGFPSFRAMGNVNGRSTNGACTVNFQQNVTSVTRTAQGKYTVLFTNNAPTAFYIVSAFVMGQSNSTSVLIHADPDATYANSFRVDGFDLGVVNSSFNNSDPVNFQFIVWGG